jgi:predicted small lipoprotein YifL
MTRAGWIAALAVLLAGCGMYGSLYLEEDAAAPPATAPAEPPPLPVDERDDEDPEARPRRADQAAPTDPTESTITPKPPTRHPDP